MRLYLDTSVLVRSLVREVGSDAAQSWLSAQDPAACIISDWVMAELSSALSLKLRAGSLREAYRAAALGTARRLAKESFTVLAVKRRHFRLAARFADRQDLGLRAGDALQLAICADSAGCLVTFDKKLAQAARAIGVPVLVP